LVGIIATHWASNNELGYLSKKLKGLTMIEIIVMLFDLVKELLNPLQIAKRQKDKKVRNLGYQLFRFYIHLHEVLVTGSSIVSSMEWYIRDAEEYYSTGKYNNISGNAVRGLLRGEIQEQSVNIRRVAHQIKMFDEELDILDAQLKRKIEVLVDSKWGFLTQLRHMLDANSFILLTDEEIINHLQQTVVRAADNRFFTRFDIPKLYHNDEREIISSNTPWTDETYRIFKLYLETRKPKEQLENLEHVLQQLHSLLKENFSIQDILITAYDKQKQESEEES
jgi:hypothetical protein